MKNKAVALLMVAALSCSIVACGGNSSTNTGSASQQPAASTAETPAEGGNEGASQAEVSVDLPKNIEMQVPASAGGGTDVVARSLSSYINSNCGVNTTVVNNTDGSGVVAMETIRTAKGDGSKILFFHTSMCIKSATGIYDKKAADDFKVIGVGTPTEKGGYVLVVPESSGITDLDGFVAAAKEADGKMMIGVETGGSSHIMAGMLSKELDIILNYVEAGPDTDKLTALVGGSINCALVNGNQAKQYIEAGKINAIACFSATEEGGRTSLLPDVPSFKELGYNCIYGTYFFVLGSPDMDDATAKAIWTMFDAAVKDPATQEILTGAGMGMEFASFEDGVSLVKAQQQSLDDVCAELGLAK